MDLMLERPSSDRKDSLSGTRSDSIDSYDSTRRASFESTRRESFDSHGRRESYDSYADEERIPQQIYFSTKKEEREREKEQQKKLTELRSQVQRLERRISLLRTENDTLRKKQEDTRPLEEKIKGLKKRNTELAAIARRLESKAKTLQSENVKPKTKTPISQDESPGEQDHVKKAFARQRAKDLAEHANKMLAKDKEIEELRKKCQNLADRLSNGEALVPQNASDFEEKEELVNIIKQAAKERLQLEQQLAALKSQHQYTGQHESETEKSKDVVPTPSSSSSQDELQQANQILHGEVQRLERALEETQLLEQELRVKTQDCSRLTLELDQSKKHTDHLEQQLVTTSSLNLDLSTKVGDLQAKLNDFESVSEECGTLRISLAAAQKEREAAQQEVNHLTVRVRSLENLVRDLQDSAEHTSSIDNQRKQIVSELQEKEQQLLQLQQVNSSLEEEHKKTVSNLHQQLSDLELQRKEEHVTRAELLEQLVQLKRESEDKRAVLQEVERLRRVLEEKEKSERAVTTDNNQNLRSFPVSQKGEEEDILVPKTSVLLEMEKRHSSVPEDDQIMTSSFLSSWAKNGPIQVYIAKYNYDPFEYSPNENPEAELPLSAGDYVLVVGEMDEDGFYEGELIDGRQGLVPSNFIEQVQDEDLADFHTALLQAGHADMSSSYHSHTSANDNINTNNNNNNDTDLDLNVNSQGKGQNVRNGDDQNDSSSDLEDIVEIDEDTVSVNSHILANGTSTSSCLPCPRSLSLDRQLSSSLLVSWRSPEMTPDLEVQSYHVYVDNQFKTSVKGNERTKALLEDVSSNQVHRVAIRCLSNKGQSRDAQCTMLVGKDVYPVPTDLKASHVTPTSACISWLPGNSNYQHSVVVNGKEVRVVKPGVFRHNLTGLSPRCLQTITLIAKSISGVLNEEKSRKWVDNVSATLTFTTPSAGAPEPPLNVQVESGPSQGTLLLSWLPVTINASGVSNGAVVSGYRVLPDGNEGTLVAGATTDHVVLTMADFMGVVPTQIAVRTVSASGIESASSDWTTLPSMLAAELRDGGGKRKVELPVRAATRKHAKSPNNEEPKNHDTDDEIEEAFREANDTTTEKVSPKPSPRKMNTSGPKEFHSLQPKVDTTTPRVVPAIEITRDSSTERGTSLEEETDGTSTTSTHTPTSTGKPTVISSQTFGEEGGGPSAFRHVEQTKHPEDAANSVSRPNQNSTRNTPSPKPRSNLEHRKRFSPASPVSQNFFHSGGDNDSISGEINPVVDENTVRLFIALFDYDPVTMSPNVDAIEEELPFREGQILKVFGDKDADGFYKGEGQGRIGFIPCNMVSEVQIDDPDLVEQLLKETGEKPTSQDLTPVNSDPHISTIPNGEPVATREHYRRMVAVYDYDPQELSPNVDAELELSFKTGDIVHIFGEMDEDGFYTGEIRGRQGLVPSNFLQPAPLDEEVLESPSVVSHSRSGESFDTSLAGNHGDRSNHSSKLVEQLSTDSNSPSKGTPPSVNSPNQPPPAELESASPGDEDKPKKKTGFLNKSKNIFKLLKR